MLRVVWPIALSLIGAFAANVIVPGAGGGGRRSTAATKAGDGGDGAQIISAISVS